MIYRNRNWTKRDYESTNVVACEADKAPGENWVPVTPAYLDALLARDGQLLYFQDGVRYFGWL